MTDDLDDDVLFYVEPGPPYYPVICTGRLIRKTCMEGTVRPATQADLDSWPAEHPPLELPEWAIFADGTPARRRPR